MLAGAPERQAEWHEAHRDLAKNQYRTSYSDMSNFREVHVKSDYPAGYGGHVPSLRYDVLFRNTSFDQKLHHRRSDPSRDSHPSFDYQISGLPSSTAFPQGAKKNPTLGVVPHDGTTTKPRAPWGVLTGGMRPLDHRTMPATMRRNASAPSLVSAGAMNAGAMQLSPTSAEGRMTPTGGSRMSPMGSPGAANLRRTVERANQEASQGRMVSEAEVLAEGMWG